MPGVLFNNLWMLGGLAALSIPVVIHLLLKRKKKRVRFSTIQFFMRQDEQSSQRRKLRNWLLLAMRLLICTLLVLAFARPYLRDAGAAGAGQGKRQVIVVLDRSLSMQANAVDGPKWARAREAVRQVLGELKPDDRAALVSCAGKAEVMSEWAPATVVARLLSDLEPSCAMASLGEGLKQAGRLLSFSDPKATTTIYVVSDLQRNGCLDLATAPLPFNATVKTVKVGDLVAPNLAVTDLQLETTGDVKPHAMITSFSDEDTPEVKLQISVDTQVVASHVVALSAGASTNIELSLPRLQPGWHDVAARVTGRDSLNLDDARYQSIFTPEPLRVLVVESRPGARAFEQESFFLTAALDPSGDGTNAVQSGFVFEKVSADELAVRLAARQKKLPCDVVVLPGLKQAPSALPLALADYVRAGGGLLLFLGEGLSAIRYNAEFRDVLPVQLGSLESNPNIDTGWRMSEYDTNTTVFAAFQLPNSGNLSLPRFTKRYSFDKTEAGVVFARFDDGMPCIVGRTLGRGRVLLVNSSADTAWNDWPKHKTFVPWLHGSSHYLATRADGDKVNQTVNFVVGSDTDIELGRGAAKASFKLLPPSGKERSLTADDQGQLRDLILPTPGIYSLRDGQGAEIRRVSVNVPVAESDLATLSANDFQQQVARVPDAPNSTLAAGLFGSGSNQKELWRVLLLAVVALLFLELIIANRTLA